MAKEQNQKKNKSCERFVKIPVWLKWLMGVVSLCVAFFCWLLIAGGNAEAEESVTLLFRSAGAFL